MNRSPESEQIGQYQLLRAIGVGGSGKVYLARKAGTQEEVAIKAVERSKLVMDNTLIYFEEEIRIHQMIKNNRIVELKEVIYGTEHIYLVLEYCQNGDLLDYIALYGQIEYGRALQYIRQLLEGVRYLHSHGIAHRDLKPENLMISRLDEIKIADFGCAYSIDVRRAVECCGTAMYVPPEVSSKRSKVQIDPFKCDIWSIGVIIYLLAVGQLPWGEDESQAIEKINSCSYTIPPNVPEELARMIQMCLRADPTRRVTVEDLLKEPCMVKIHNKLLRRSMAAGVVCKSVNVSARWAKRPKPPFVKCQCKTLDPLQRTFA